MTSFRRKNGFTLLELILVIALMGIATSLGVTMLFKVADAWRVTSNRCELDHRAAQIFKAIGNDMAEMLSPSATGVPFKAEAGTGTLDKDPFYKTQVERDRLLVSAMLSSRDAANTAPVRADVEYVVENKENGSNLVRIERAPGMDPGKGVRTELDNAVISFRVESLAREAGATWQPGWTKATAPKAIRVSVVLANPNNPLEQIVRMAVFPVEVD